MDDLPLIAYWFSLRKSSAVPLIALMCGSQQSPLFSVTLKYLEVSVQGMVLPNILKDMLGSLAVLKADLQLSGLNIWGRLIS